MRFILETRDPDQMLEYFNGIQIHVSDLAIRGPTKDFYYKRELIDLGRCQVVRTDHSQYRVSIDQEERVYALGSQQGARTVVSGGLHLTLAVGRSAVILPADKIRFDYECNVSGFMVMTRLRELITYLQ